MKVYRSIFFVFILLGFILSGNNSFAQCSFTNLNTTYCSSDAAFTLTGGTNYYGPGVSGTTFNPSSVLPGIYTFVTTNDLTATYNTVTTGTFNPLTITSPTSLLLTDNTSALVNLPGGFSFSFFGSSFTSVRIYDNGFVRFIANGGAGVAPQLIPNAGAPNNIIACAWSDLDPTTGIIEYGTVGTAPTRIFVINYLNVQFKASTEYVTTQIQLHEKSNIIEIHSIHIGSTGGNKTMGIENNAGNLAYTAAARNQSVWTADNDYIGFFPVCSEERTVTILGGPSSSLSVFPTSSSVCAGSTVPVTIGSSEVGIDYQLQNNADSSPLSAFVSGNGSNLTITTAALFANTTVKVFSRNSSTLCSRDLTNKATITVNQTATVSLADIDQNQCNNGSFTLSGNIPTVGTGTWTLVSGTATITTASLHNTTVTGVPVGTSATLRWTISNGVCAPSSDDVVLTNYQTPTVSAANIDQEQCTNGTFILSGNTATIGTGLWSVVTGTATISNPSVSGSTVTGVPVGTSATLRWTISNGVCAPSSDDVVLTNYQTATVSLADIDQNQCNNGSFTLSGNIPTVGTGTWTLVSGTATITTASLHNTTVTGVPVGTSATLRWTISNGVCAPSSDDVVLTNYQTPTVSAANIDQEQCTNGTFILSGNTATIGTGLWSVVTGTATISNPSVSGSTVTGVPVGTSATLRWTISNGVCAPSSDDVVLTNYQTPTVSLADVDQNQCNNGSFTLSGNIPTVGTGTWTLVSGTATITTASLHNTTVTGVPVGTSATLRWTISNGVCAPSSDDVVLTNYQTPTVSAANIDQEQCTNGTFILSGNTATIGTGLWSVVTGTATISNPSVSGSTVTGVPVGTSATLRWTISNGVCAPSSDDVVLTNYQTATVSLADIDQNQCNNGSFTLSGNIPTVGTGTWTLVSGTATITTASLHNTTVTGVPVGTSATLRWTISNGVCAPSSDDVVLTNYQTPTVSAANIDQEQCTNGTFILSGNTATIGTGLWSVVTGTATISNPSVSGSTVTGVPVGTSATLRWTISNGVCAPSSDDVVLTNYQTATVSLADIDQNQCNNGSFTLSGNIPTVGTGTWTLVSGTATITTASLHNTTVTGVPVGTSATLRWTISNGVCAPSSDDVVLTNYQTPTVSAANIDQEQCTNGTFILSGNTATIGTGLWSVVTGTATISNPSVSGSTVTGVPVGTSATLRWTISNGVCAPSSDDVVLTNYQTPTVSLADVDQNQCNNGSFTLSGNIPTVGTGTWTLVSGTATITTASLHNTTVTGVPVGTSATLRWTISNGVCAPSSDDVVLTNYQTPTVSAANIDQEQCTNGTFILSGNTATIGTGLWSVVTGTATISNPSVSGSTVTGVPVGTSATLRWTISNGVCAPSSDDVVLTNYQTATVSLADIDQNQCNNGSFTLSGNIPTVGTGTWTLVSGTATITTASLHNTTVTGVPVGTSATLRWTISNGVCAPSSDDVVLTNYQTPTVSAANIDQEQCTNGTFILSGNTATIGTGLWSVVTGTATISNPSVSGSTVTGVPVGTSATLRWTISNGVCAPSSDDVVLTNYQTPTSANAGIDQSNCGTSASLNANVAVIGSGSWTIISGAGGIIAVPTSETSLFTGVTGTTYILRWTIINGVCSSQDDVQVELKRIPDVAASGKAICSYENTNIGITNPNSVSGTTFSWVIVSPNNVTGAIAGIGPTISQSLHSTDGITQGQVVYRITPMVNGCPGNYIDITVYIDPVPVITNTPSSLVNSICSGVTLNFIPSSTIGSTIMTWSSTNATNGTGAITEALVNSTSTTQTVTYNITPSVGTCSGQSVNYVVEVKPLPSASGTSVIICSDDIAQINLSASPKNISGTSFVWTASPSGNIAGASDGNGSVISQKLNATNASIGFVTYHVTPTAFGCDGPVTDIVAQINPKVTVNAGADYSVCEPTSILVSGSIGGSATTGTWSIVKGYGTLSASSLGSTVNSTYTVAANDVVDGYITLRLTTNDPDGAQPCSLLFDDLRIEIHKKATVTVPANYNVCEPTQISLFGTVGGGAVSGTWSLISGNGTLSVSSVTVNGTSKDVTAIYYPNGTDVNTVVKFRLTTDDPDGSGAFGPCVNEFADIDITINKAARVNAGVDFEICEDGYVQLNGSYSGATSSVTWSENSHTGNAQFSDIISVNSKYFLRPGIDVGSIIFTLTTNDPDGSGPGGPCTNQSDDVIVIINKLPTVALTNLNSIYQEDDPIVTMAGFPSGAGGVFTGPGVIAGTNKFDPANADIGLNTITYTYTDSKNCTNSVSKTITVNSLTTIDFGIIIAGSPVNNGIGLPEIEICANIGIARLRGMPKYTDGLTPTVDTYFKGVISSPLITVALDAFGYYINTTGLVPGEYYIQYTFKDATTTATSSLAKKIIIKEAPVAIIGAMDHCIDSPVQFTDLSTPAANIDTWAWDFDDGGTQSNLQNPIHDYSLTQPRSHLITLKVTTTQGCSNTAMKSIIIGSPPIPDFNWTKLCSGDATRFSNSSTIVTGTINGYGWDFDDGNTTTVSSGAIAPIDNNGNRTSGTYKNPRHKYDNSGDFNVTLSVSTSEGCVKTITKRIYILKAPSIDVNGYYSESFTEDVSSWIKTDLSSSWIFDVPQGDVINKAYTGSKVWWTGANTNKITDRSTYFTNEKSDVIGPCLNLSTIKRPMISLHYWSDVQIGFDGTVVQYSTDGALTWKTIGDAGGAGVNWYDSKNLSGAPGEQDNYAWSEENSGWKNARFNLDQIPDDKRDTVVFRIAFGSNNDNLPGRSLNGFAFDDVYIGEKQRNVLVEHFTNLPAVSAATYLDNLYDFQTDPTQTTYKTESDFIKIQYHMGNPNKEDSIYKVNPFDPTARAFYYQASQPPFTVMDGILGYFGDDRDSLVLNGDHALLNSEVIDRRALEDPLFNLTVNFSVLDESRLKASVNVIYKDSINLYNSPVVFHAVLIENSIGSLRNIVKKLLPDVEGKLLAGPWQNGTQVTVSVDYKMDVHITNPDGLYLTVFVQDKITGRIHQSVTVKAPKLDGPQVVGLPDEPLIAELSGLHIYPNPASNVIKFEHGKLLGSYTWKMIDQRGVSVLSGKLQNDSSQPQSVDISSLANAMYIVVIGTENGSVIHQKITIMNQH